MTALIELRVLMLREFSDKYTWTAEQIESFYNEGSHCLGTEILDLAASEQAEDGTCDTCDRTEVKFVREATPSDIERYKLREKCTPPALSSAK